MRTENWAKGASKVRSPGERHGKDGRPGGEPEQWMTLSDPPLSWCQHCLWGHNDLMFSPPHNLLNMQLSEVIFVSPGLVPCKMGLRAAHTGTRGEGSWALEASSVKG